MRMKDKPINQPYKFKATAQEQVLKYLKNNKVMANVKILSQYLNRSPQRICQLIDILKKKGKVRTVKEQGHKGMLILLKR